MDMCYDGALVLPSSYAVMNEEEMTYMEGGIRDRKSTRLNSSHSSVSRMPSSA